MPIRQGTRGLIYTYDVNATDPNQDSLQYRLVTAPVGMTMAPTTGRITWSPTTASAVTVTVEVRDGRGGMATQTFTLTVADRTHPNTPPVAQTGPDQTVVVGATVQLDGAGSTDDDGDPL